MRVSSLSRSRPRWIAAIVLTCFIWQTVEGANLLAWEQVTEPASTAPPRAFDELQRAVDALDDSLADLDARIDATADLAPGLSAVDDRSAAVDAADARVRAAMDAIARRLDETGAAPEVRERQRQFVEAYYADVSAVRRDLEAVKSSPRDLMRSRIENARGRLRRRDARPHTPLDPQKLPHRPPAPKERPPRLKPEQFSEQKPLQVASAGDPFALLASQDAAAPSAPENLAETIDAPFTPGIRDLAASLRNHPLAIYNWVRQNVTFVPTFGSIQGAEGCRVSRECNAYDAASLLVALLRVSGVPARYVLGTLELGPDFFRSAIGDFQDVQAAARLASSGGIPVAVVNNGAGQIVAVRMEHAWVEAFVDYVPSRGAIKGDGDTWVPLEPVLKRMRYRPPVDLAAAGVDPQVIFDALRATAALGDAGNSITGLSATDANARLTGAVAALRSYFDARPDATVADLFGALDNLARPVAVLPPNLPGRVLIAGARLSSLTAANRHQLTLRVTDQFGLTEQIRFERSTAELAGRRLTLGYVPAAAADAAAIESFGGMFSTPAYLVNLRPVLYLDGVPAGTGAPTRMGSRQQVVVSFREPDGATDSVEHAITAGTYAAVGLDLQRVTREALDARRQKLDATRAEVGVRDVNWDDMLGETLHVHAQSYFLQVDATNRISAQQLNVGALKRPAEMLATYAPAFSSLFGTPVSVTRTGMNVDVRRYIVSVSSRTGQRDREKTYMVSTGSFASAAEHAVFEELQNARSVSAIKLIAEANNRGIPVFAIDASNAASILPQLRVSGAVLADVRNAIASGRQVLIPRDELTFLDWRGSGYIVMDPETGAAGYLISGGLAGGGTAEQSEIKDILDQIMKILSFLLDEFTTIAGALRVLSKAAAWADKIGKVLIALSAISTAFGMYQDTGSILKSIAAGLIDVAFSLAAAAAITYLATLGVGVIALVISVVVITIAITLIENVILEVLKGVRLFEPVRRWLARWETGPPWHTHSTALRPVWGAA